MTAKHCQTHRQAPTDTHTFYKTLRTHSVQNCGKKCSWQQKDYNASCADQPFNTNTNIVNTKIGGGGAEQALGLLYFRTINKIFYQPFFYISVLNVFLLQL